MLGICDIMKCRYQCESFDTLTTSRKIQLVDVAITSEPRQELTKVAMVAYTKLFRED